MRCYVSTSESGTEAEADGMSPILKAMQVEETAYVQIRTRLILWRGNRALNCCFLRS